MPFTDKQVAALKPKAQRYEKGEPGRTGLGVRVSPSGGKTWVFRYRLGGEQKRMVFGPYPKVTLYDAHAMLSDARRKLREGVDPGEEVAAEREAERKAETVADLVGEYVERHARKVMRKNSSAEDERLLNREVLPALGKLRAKDVTRRDIIKLLDKIEDRGAPVMRNRAAGVLSRLFHFALDRGVIDASPASGVRRLEEQPRNRVLTAEEIRSLWNGLDGTDMTPAVRTALRFLMATGQRRAEVVGAVRSEIDDEQKLWRLPGARAKNGRENLIPLPPLAMRLVAEADAVRVKPLPVRLNRKDRPAYDPRPSPHLFPARMTNKSIEPAALTRALNRNRDKLGIGDATVHDIRRTFATWHGELGTAPEILSGLLNHTPQTITGRVYNHSVNLDRKRHAMETWCATLERIISGDETAKDSNVVALKA